MDPLSRTRAAHYDRMSRWYDRIAGPSEGRFRDKALALLQVSPGERVLEIGCGTGHALLALAHQAGPSGRVWGMDLSRGMCRISRDRLREAAMPQAAVLRGDAVSLPFPDEVCDAIFASFTVELFPTGVLASVLQECRRVLRGAVPEGEGRIDATQPAGRLALAAMLAPERQNLMTRLYAWAGQRFPDWVDCRPIAGAALLSANGFHLLETWQGNLWGLPVQVVVASKHGS